MIEIRPAIVDDLPEIQACALKAYSIYIDRIGQKPAPMRADFVKQIKSEQIYLAELNGFFAAYVVFYPEGDALHLESVAVLPEHAGQGIGKKLIEYVETIAADNEFLAVELYTNESMADNLLIYPRLGYTETHRKVETGFKRIYFRKLI